MSVTNAKSAKRRQSGGAGPKWHQTQTDAPISLATAITTAICSFRTSHFWIAACSLWIHHSGFFLSRLKSRHQRHIVKRASLFPPDKLLLPSPKQM